MEEFEAMKDLRHRLNEKAVLLSRMAEEATDYGEIRRLTGKAAGVGLALSFVDEYLRGQA